MRMRAQALLLVVVAGIAFSVTWAVQSHEARKPVPSIPATDAPRSPTANHGSVAGALRKEEGEPVVIAAATADDPIAILQRGLASSDETTPIAAVEDAVHANAAGVLPVLARIELAGDPRAAPSVIHGVAALGAKGSTRDREAASATLARWLDEERARDSVDALGNVSNIVEALGAVGGGGAVFALTAALDRHDLPLYVETLAVQQLGELRDPSARAAVERFATRVAALPDADGVEGELAVEARAAALMTLERFHG